MSLSGVILSLTALGSLQLALAPGAGFRSHGADPGVETPSGRRVVTVSGGEWLHRSQHSGVGETSPVVVRAAPGDTVVFRQADGHHGVFFYVTRPTESELGRRIVVDRDFVRLSGRPFERPSNRLFSRRTLATGAGYGKESILTIELAGNFQRPIYFGCPIHSSSGGNREFGVIVSSPPQPPRVLDPAAMREVESATIEPPLLGARSRDLGTLTGSGVWSWELRTDPYRLLVGRRDGEQADRTDQWFADVPTVDPRVAQWYHVTPADLDGDGDFDLVVAVGSPSGDGWRWWTLESSVADRVPADPDAFRFKKATQIGDRDLPLEWAGTAHGVVADVNRDRRPDLVLYEGDPQGDLRLYYNRSTTSREERFTLRESEQPIDISRDFGSVSPYYIYAYDFDIDGYVDLLMGAEGQDAIVYYNDATGRFPYTYAKPVPESSSRIVNVGVADGDGDDLPDLVLTLGTGERIVRYNRGDARKLTLQPDTARNGDQIPQPPPRVLTREIPDAVVNERYTVQFSGTGTGALTWEFGGLLPRGLEFTSDGIAGTARSPGTSTVSVTVTDEQDRTAGPVDLRLRVVDPAASARQRVRELEAETVSLEVELADARRAAEESDSTVQVLDAELQQARADLKKQRNCCADPRGVSLFNWLTVTFMGLSIAAAAAWSWLLIRRRVTSGIPDTTRT